MECTTLFIIPFQKNITIPASYYPSDLLSQRFLNTIGYDNIINIRNIVNIVHPRSIMKVETISEAQRTGWNLAASNLSDTAQVHLYLPFFLEISCYVGPGGALGQPARPCHEADWAQARRVHPSGV